MRVLLGGGRSYWKDPRMGQRPVGDSLEGRSVGKAKA